MGKKSGIKWETEYNKYYSGEYDQEYEELRLKFERDSSSIQGTIRQDDKSMQDSIKNGKEQYEKYKKMKRIKENISKVKNIIKYRDKLEEQITEIDEALKSKKGTDIEKLEQDCEKLEEDLKVLQENERNIELKLKKKDLLDKEKSALRDELDKVQLKIQANSFEFSRIQNSIGAYKNAKNNSKSKFDKLSAEQLNGLKLDLCTKRSKCNMACKYMMQGKSWNAVEVKLDNWDKSKYTVHNNLRGKSLVQNKIRAMKAKKDELAQRKADLAVRKEKYEKKCSALANMQDTKWYQFVQRFKNWRTKRALTKELENEEEELIAEQEEIQKIEKITNKTKSKDDDFKAYLKAVAEKGMDTINKEKIAKMKEEAANKYADKYGKDENGKIINSRYNQQDGVNR